MISRRQLLIAVGAGLAAWPLVATTREGKEKVYRIGCVPGGPLAPREHQWAAFRQGLRDFGYEEGKNVALEFRIPSGEGIPVDNLIADLVRINVDVIVVSTTPAVQAAKRVTTTVPIVMTGAADPVMSGLVPNLARPGGNVTGLSLMPVELTGKRFEILREIVPKSMRIAVLWNPNEANNVSQFKTVQSAARTSRIEVLSLEARTEAELDRAFQSAASRRADGLIVVNSGIFYGLRARIMDHALKARLPAIWGYPSFGDFGALVVYGPSDTDNYRRAASYVDRILKGARPADLPIEQPTEIKLVINLKTANALGLTIPQLLLIRADRVIE